MINSIAVPLDGSPQAEHVLPYVAAVARGADASVVLLHAIGGSRLVTGRLLNEAEQVAYLEQLQAESRQAAENYLDEHARGLKDLGITVSTSILHGQPTHAIGEYGSLHMPSLIAVSTQGRSGLSGVSLGSVASHLLTQSRVPLLLVHPDEPVTRPVAHVRQIVVPLDTSDLAETVLPAARDLARGLGATITLVTALPTTSHLYLGAELVSHPTNVLKRAEDYATDYLKQVHARLEAEGLAVRWRIIHGDAAKAIHEHTVDEADTIVAMATHGRSGLSRWVVGSVTDKVVRLGGVPILIVRPSN